METTMKLGHIDYLNCYPFYYHLFEKEPLREVEIISGVPRTLNLMMMNGKLDLSPISSVTCAEISTDVLVLPEFCLSSVGYVGSVMLISKFPIEELNGKTIGLTRASNTSIVLLKILLKKYYHLDPVYVPTDPRPRLKDPTLKHIDAALIIGNDAMVKAPMPTAYNYDLGDLWLRKTGFPVVFAIFALRESIAEEYKDKIQAVISSYHKSLHCLDNEKADVILTARQRYPEIIYDIDAYYDLLKFEFTEDLKKALMFYYSEAEEMGFLKKVDRLRYLHEYRVQDPRDRD